MPLQTSVSCEMLRSEELFPLGGVHHWLAISGLQMEHIMDKDRIDGAAKQAKGAVKEATGKALGDSKLVADGKSDKVEGKVQNAVGGLKDALKK
jgi:uncharacterized protein YjbJ (UPF0337 family)